jgi:sugar phosphate isomerase/epimerase
MRFAICNELFENWDFARQCSFAAESGYTGIELAPFTLAPRITDVTAATRRTMRRQAEEAGLEIIGLHWLLAKTEGLHLTAADPSVRAATTAYLIELARACHDLGGNLMIFGSPAQRNLEQGVSREEGHARAAETFRGCLDALADLGVTLCLEPLTTQETNFITTAAEGAELVARMDHPNFRLHLDTKAMSSEGTPIPDLIRKFGGQAAHFHANDANRLGPGFGEIDFVPIFQALKDVGYDGWVSVEVFDYSPGPERLATESLAYMRKCVEETG